MNIKNNLSLIVLVSIFSFGLVACTTAQLKVAGSGAVAVSTAPAVAELIKVCVQDDETALAALQEPFEFFSTGHGVITDRGADTLVLDLINEFPDYYDEVRPQWRNIWTALAGKDCGEPVRKWRKASEDAFNMVVRVAETNDRFQTACSLYEAYAPLAIIITKTPLPTQVPGCVESKVPA